MPNIHTFESPEELFRAAASRFVETASASRSESGRFSVALAGGSTPKRVYELLAGDDFRGRVDWAKCHVFFGDERCVPPRHPESNYGMANGALLSRVDLPEENVHRIVGEGDAVANASLYEDELRSFFGAAEWPRFDLVLLGMGDDGHTASLFPHAEALREQSAWVAGVRVEKLNAFRITLTAPAINRARHVMFMVAGAGKAESLRDVVAGPYEPERLPAQLIKPIDGELVWLVDKSVASKL